MPLSPTTAAMIDGTSAETASAGPARRFSVADLAAPSVFTDPQGGESNPRDPGDDRDLDNRTDRDFDEDRMQDRERATRYDDNEVLPVTGEKMPWEVMVAAAGTSNDDFDAGGAQFAGSVGYYLEESILLSVRQNLSFADGGPNSSTIWNGATRIAFDYHVPAGPIVPFIGASVGWTYGDSVKETPVIGPEAGVKVYLKEDAFLMALAEYQFFVNRDDSVRNAFEDGQMIYGIAFGLRF